jgi:hypothetical protein
MCNSPRKEFNKLLYCVYYSCHLLSIIFLVLKPNQIQLEEKQEQDGDHPLQQAPREIFNDEEEQLVNGFEQKLHVPKREEQPHPEPIDNKVWQRDIQWGRNTLQKLLTSLGLL